MPTSLQSSQKKPAQKAFNQLSIEQWREFPGIERLLIAMQTSDKYGVATPADWRPGEEVICSTAWTLQRWLGWSRFECEACRASNEPDISSFSPIEMDQFP